MLLSVGVDEIYEEWQGEEPPTDEQLAELGDDEECDWRQRTRDRLKDAIKMVQAGARDLSSMTVHGREIVIGGGSSWGDTPEGFTDVLLVFLSGVGQGAEEP